MENIISLNEESGLAKVWRISSSIACADPCFGFRYCGRFLNKEIWVKESLFFNKIIDNHEFVDVFNIFD